MNDLNWQPTCCNAASHVPHRFSLTQVLGSLTELIPSHNELLHVRVGIVVWGGWAAEAAHIGSPPRRAAQLQSTIEMLTTTATQLQSNLCLFQGLQKLPRPLVPVQLAPRRSTIYLSSKAQLQALLLLPIRPSSGLRPLCPPFLDRH